MHINKILFFSLFMFLMYIFFIDNSFISLNLRLLNSENAYNNFLYRIGMAQNALLEVKQSPIIGLGNSPVPIDNQFARTIFESGFLGFLMLMLLFSSLCWNSLKSFKKYNYFSFLAFFLTVMILINFFSSAIFQFTQIIGLYLSFVAIAKYN